MVKLYKMELQQKSQRTNFQLNYISISYVKPKCIPNNEHHNCSIDLQHTSNVFLKPNNLWNTYRAALMRVNYKTDWDSICNQYPQTITHQLRTDLCPLFSSLRPMDSKRNDMRVSTALFRRIYLPTDE